MPKTTTIDTKISILVWKLFGTIIFIVDEEENGKGCSWSAIFSMMLLKECSGSVSSGHCNEKIFFVIQMANFFFQKMKNGGWW